LTTEFYKSFTYLLTCLSIQFRHQETHPFSKHVVHIWNELLQLAVDHCAVNSVRRLVTFFVLTGYLN